ncbi:U7 snRNA-associated Sm-like protein LSm11 [Chanos chanos]|uniref:U7 snRNA-associated Sm-like protein LSm11 n=1 Tax=Chanos chanos TaxID=29144 RepID=A0A6J2UMU4_CHACN|nr:U7 snRNA-associated Sm-like protein LSm11 [Chanos chanos]
MEERERKVPGEGKPDSGQEASLSVRDQEKPGEDSDRKLSEDEDFDTQLDVSSDKFDPLRALYSPEVPLPYPNIKCFNNIAEYESFMKGGRGRAKPENVEKRLRKAKKGVADPERIERLKKLMVNNPVEEGEGSGVKRPPRKQKAPKNVLTRMSSHAGSPLGQLNRCVQDKIRVKVHIRTFKGLRGVCSGFVVAFDKFWNMAMVDVDETYREPLLGEALYHEKALTVTRLFEKLKLQENEELRAVEEMKLGSKDAARTPQPDAKEEGPSHTLHRSTRGNSRRDPRVPTDGHSLPEKSTTTPGASATEHETEEKQRPRDSKPKTKYGKVHTRHVNQLFIRGENVLIVTIQQD